MNSDLEAKIAFDAAWEDDEPGRCETCSGWLDAGNRCPVCDPELYPEQETCEGCGNPSVTERQLSDKYPTTVLLCDECWDDYKRQPAAGVTPGEPSEEARDFLRRAQGNPAFRGMIERLGEE